MRIEPKKNAELKHLKFYISWHLIMFDAIFKVTNGVKEQRHSIYAMQIRT